MPILWLYIAAKVLAYIGWCWVGLLRRARHRPAGVETTSGRPSMRLALLLGLFRAALGAGFGIGIWLGSSATVVALHGLGLHGGLAELLSYLAVYVPVRVIEWGIVGRIGLGRFDWPWIAGGIGVSVLLDVPLMVTLGGLPLGRFMC